MLTSGNTVEWPKKVVFSLQLSMKGKTVYFYNVLKWCLCDLMLPTFQHHIYRPVTVMFTYFSVATFICYI